MHSYVFTGTEVTSFPTILSAQGGGSDLRPGDVVESEVPLLHALLQPADQDAHDAAVAAAQAELEASLAPAVDDTADVDAAVAAAKADADAAAAMEAAAATEAAKAAEKANKSKSDPAGDAGSAE